MTHSRVAGDLHLPSLLMCAVLGGCTGLAPDSSDRFHDNRGEPAASSLPAVEPLSLAPVADFHELEYVPRSHPKHLLLSSDERTLFVATEGNEIDPRSEILVIDVEQFSVTKRIPVGRAPQGMALSRDGKTLYVANQLSNFLSVIDTAALEAVATIPVTFYAQHIAVSEDGGALYLTNRFLDAVEVVTLNVPHGRSGTVTSAISLPPHANPRDVVLGPDGMLYVGNLSATSVSRLDPATGAAAETLHTNSPINGLATDGRFIFVATLGRGDGHGKLPGVTDAGVAYRGDSTASLGFSDINNDVMVLDTADRTLKQLHRYTSDTAESSTRDAKGDFTPEEMIVAGALPEQLIVHRGQLLMTLSSSDQVQIFDIDPLTGALTSSRVIDTGINPFQLAASSDSRFVYTADRLGDTVSRIDVATNIRTSLQVSVTPRQYPATRYEMGEMLFHSARFSSEALPSTVFPSGDKAGDKSCNHCHREAMTDGKVWTVGIGKVVPLGGERIPPSARNIRDTMMLFWEGVQTKEDFDLESNEFAPPEDYGCDKDATEETPEVCAARDAFFKKQVGLTFRQVGRELLGDFLVGRPRLLPNPRAQFPSADEAAAAARGKALFLSTAVRCSECHPTVDVDPTQPFTLNTTIDTVITETAFDSAVPFKTRKPGTFNIPSLRGLWDRPAVFTHDGRAKSIQSAILSPGHPGLEAGRDGCQRLADNVDQFVNDLPRPVRNGLGCNELAGVKDSHGTTSQLSAEQVQDLVTFVLSIQ